MSEIDIENKAYQNGLLNPEAPSGKGTIIEYVVLTVMGDCVKESFNFPYDLTSKRLGEINVKSSARHHTQNGNVWTFGKTPDSYIPDYYVCVGLDESYSKVLHVWEIPSSERIIGSYSIHVIDTLRGLKRVAKYEVNPSKYNDVFQSMNITEFSEFKNVYNDILKQNMDIARRINGDIPVAEIENEFGEGYYQKYLNWICENNFKKYFNKNTGLIGIFPKEDLEEITESTYPVFDCRGTYTGFINRGQFEKFRVKNELPNNINPIKLLKNVVWELTEKHGSANLEEIIDITGIDEAEKYLLRMLYYGDIRHVDSSHYACYNKPTGEMSNAERMITIRGAFKKLSKINKKIYLNQLEEETGFKDMEREINFLMRKGYILKLENNEFRWV